jgi:general stress protein 26
MAVIDDAQRELLQKAVIVRVNTITPEGYPHSVPVWFLLEGDDLIVFSDRSARKVKNVQQNPKGSLAYGGDPVGSPCLLVEGDWTLEDDADHAITARITHYYEPQDAAQQWLDAWKDADHAILRLKPRRVIRIS